MDIKTKFAIGDTIWTLRDLKPVEFEVGSISVTQAKTVPPQNIITYGSCTIEAYICANENECFASREELLNYINAR